MKDVLLNDGVTPMVTVGMTVYNGERYLREALDALLAQDYENFELIISDNASIDTTEQICTEYAACDARISYHRNAINLGAIRNFNLVFEMSSGEYFMWAADHDVWEPTFISSCVEVLEQDSSVVLCHPLTKWIETDGTRGEVIPPRLDTRGMERASRFNVVMWSLGHCYQVYGLARTSELRRTKLYRNAIGPDIILLAELALLGSFAHVPEPLFYLRRMPDIGSWESYVRKLNKRLTRWTAVSLYWEMISHHLQAVNAHVRGLIGRAALMLSVIICMLFKYHWILKSLVASSKQKQAKSA